MVKSGECCGVISMSCEKQFASGNGFQLLSLFGGEKDQIHNNGSSFANQGRDQVRFPDSEPSAFVPMYLVLSGVGFHLLKKQSKEDALASKRQ